MKVMTVGSIGISRNNHNIVSILVEDNHSGDKILELSLTLEQYGLLMTGLSGIKGVMEVNTSANIAKCRQVQTIVAPNIPKYQDNSATAARVEDHFTQTGLVLEGWSIHSNGTNSQQNNKNGYEYSIKRYVDKENPPEVVKDY